jgi:hypothetical protein
LARPLRPGRTARQQRDGHHPRRPHQAGDAGRAAQRDGTYQPSNAANGRTEAITARLRAFAAEPARVAKDSARLTGRCCFCNLALKDERSTAVGYGATCADHFGLPWGERPAGFAEGPTTNAEADYVRKTGKDY